MAWRAARSTEQHDDAIIGLVAMRARLVVRCPSCGFDGPEGARFCAQCGEPLALSCPACGAVAPPTHKFCAACGTPLPTVPTGPGIVATPAVRRDGERRQVTVLFVDLVGYTRLVSELDPEEVHALLGRFFARADRIVRDFGGSVDKHIGDCVMAVFGAPVAHGNDPERAVRAALAIREALPALSREFGRGVSVHIGIASGQVVAAATGNDAGRELTGDSVNLAARLTDRAGSNEILISDAVRRRLPDGFGCSSIGAIGVKGLVAPVTAWRLVGIAEAGSASSRPFVGRRAELAQFQGVLEACRESGSGHTIYLRGSAGIGKTRLIEEFRRQAEALGFASHVGLVLDFGTGAGQDAIGALIRSLLNLSGASGVEAARAAAERAVAEGLIADEGRVYLNDLLDLPQPLELRAVYDAMDNQRRQRGKQETIARLVETATAHRLRLLIVEDVHWADRQTLEQLASLARTVARTPALLVMTSRVEGDPLDQAWRAALAGAPLLTIDLGPLRPNEAMQLAEAYLETSSEFARRCLERADGNPLFLEQLLRHAEERAESGVPGSVQSLVQARMDQLEPSDREALLAASVFGQRFGLEALRHLLERPDQGCERLVEQLLVRPEGDDFLFAHALIRDAVYDTLLKASRRALHRRAAGWFEGRDPVLCAEHLDRAEDPAAAGAYLEAARREAAAYHYEAALGLVERGLAVATEAADRAALTCLQGELWHDLGAMPASRAAYEAALAAAGDDGCARCRAWIGLAAVKRVTEDLDGAFAELARAQGVAERYGLVEELARIHFLRGNLHFPRGRIEECLTEHKKSLELARRCGSAELEAQALGGLGDAEYMRGRMLSSGRAFRSCIELCRRHGFGRIEVASRPMAAFARLSAAELEGALEDSLDAIEAATRVGHQRAEVVARHCAVFCRIERGELAAARADAERAITVARQLGARRFEAEGLGLLGAVEAAAGRRPAAAELVREALAISREIGMAYWGAVLLGWLALDSDDAEERQAALAEGEALLNAGGLVSHNYLLFYRAAIEAALDGGDWAAAERYAAAVEDYTRPEPLPWIDFAIARGRALAAWGRGPRDAAASERLEALRAQAERAGLRAALPAIEAALAGKESPPPATTMDVSA
jgi:class 3 adenylate cyclase/tetratricopeptide (TPR) repeat protein